MPTYDYVCDGCGHKFELFQSMSEATKKKCPKCKKSKLRRLFGAGAALMFKGSGFYITDYRSEAYKKQAAADSKSGATGSSDGGSGGKSDGGTSNKSSSKDS